MSNKESALLSIDNNKELFIDLSDDIWEHPETGFHEHFAMENYCRILEEHGFQIKKNLAGIPTEASIYNMLEKALPGKVTNVYAHPSGGGKYMAVLQCRKTVHTDEGKQRQAALLAFSAFPELKHVILVDEDVDIFDTRDVLWAMNTRFQGDRDIITIPGVRFVIQAVRHGDRAIFKFPHIKMVAYPIRILGTPGALLCSQQFFHFCHSLSMLKF